jgi:hypothetical protein
MRLRGGTFAAKGGRKLTLEDESASYQLVGGVKAYQGEDG